MKPRNELHRLVRLPGASALIFDITGKRMGRGYYICKEGDCVHRLLKERRFRKHYSSMIEEESMQKLAEICSHAGGKDGQGQGL
ncbi:MAG: YlxR family protein [Chloroflexi bacterium]|nr:YlxR family protein [Chloroflexota bacterium]